MQTTYPRFAGRTGWNLEWNKLAALREKRQTEGRLTLDLTESNPTDCKLDYRDEEILTALADRRSMIYEPQPRGLLAAREAVVKYYAASNVPIGPDHVVLTSGSSEAYGFLFRLLMDPGDKILVPQPGYPLFDFLSRLNDLELTGYQLEYHQGWEIDFESLESTLNSRTRAVIVVNPNNPTGSLVGPRERQRLVDFCLRHGLSLIADEVFLDYCFPPAKGVAGTLAATSDVLTFTLNGLSKTAALPQMKLGWIVASGPSEAVEEALARLEVIADTYLSVGTPVQRALPKLLAGRHPMQQQILARTSENLKCLDRQLAAQTLSSRLKVEAGWSVILRVPMVRSDEEWALELLEKDGVLLYPGHFFNFAREGYLVASLLPPPEIFSEGIGKLLDRVSNF